MAGPGILLYALLGAVQGIVEWFPLSSSGQLSLALQSAGVPPVEAISTALWIHSGSLVAILVRFRREFILMARSVPSALSREAREGALARFVIVGTILTGIVGIPVYLALSSWFQRNPGGQAFSLLVGALLVVTGLTLMAGARIQRGTRGLEDIGWFDGVAAGAAQGFAILPGISRSGFTVAALLARQVEKADALKLSFLLDAPAIVGAMILTYEGSVAFSLPMAVAVGTAFAVSYVSMTALIAFARRVDLSRFCILYGSLAAAAAVVQILV